MIGQKTICLVDDDDDDRLLIKGALESVMKGIKIIEFDNGVDFLEQFRQLDPVFNSVFILLDINMPRMSGLEVMSVLRADYDSKSLPIFVISTASNPGLIEEIFATGASEYFGKPDSLKGIDMLAETIKEHVIREQID